MNEHGKFQPVEDVWPISPWTKKSRGCLRLCEKPWDSTPGAPGTPNPVGAFVESHGPPKKQSTAVARDFFSGAIFVAAFGCAIFGDRFWFETVEAANFNHQPGCLRGFCFVNIFLFSRWELEEDYDKNLRTRLSYGLKGCQDPRDGDVMPQLQGWSSDWCCKMHQHIILEYCNISYNLWYHICIHNIHISEFRNI